MCVPSQVIEGDQTHSIDGWRRVLALKGYIDDSGSEPSSPVYVLGGLVLPVGWWNQIIADWDAVLKSAPRVEYFKGSEVWDRVKGPFRALSDQERMAKVDALADILAEHHPAAFSLRVEWSVFRAFTEAVPIHPDKNDPYFFLFYGMIAQMSLWSHKEPNFGPVDIIFDNQNKIGDKALGWYDFFKANTTPETQGMLGKKPEFKDEKEELPLQAADMFAWYRRRHAIGTLHREWHNNVWQRLTRHHQSSVSGRENPSGVTQKRPCRVTSKPAMLEAQDRSFDWGAGSLGWHGQCLERSEATAGGCAGAAGMVATAD